MGALHTHSLVRVDIVHIDDFRKKKNVQQLEKNQFFWTEPQPIFNVDWPSHRNAMFPYDGRIATYYVLHDIPTALKETLIDH